MLRGALIRPARILVLPYPALLAHMAAPRRNPLALSGSPWHGDKNDAIRLQIPGSRERFQILVAAIGLDLMRRQVLNLPLSRTTSSALFIETLKPLETRQIASANPITWRNIKFRGYGSRL